SRRDAARSHRPRRPGREPGGARLLRRGHQGARWTLRRDGNQRQPERRSRLRRRRAQGRPLPRRDAHVLSPLRGARPRASPHLTSSPGRRARVTTFSSARLRQRAPSYRPVPIGPFLSPCPDAPAQRPSPPFPMQPGPSLHLFEAIGIELEYMIVDAETLDVRPIADALLTREAGAPVLSLDRGPVAWSNELALHVIELKTNGPTVDLDRAALDFQANVRAASAHLSPLAARLLPTGMHPW